MDQRAKSDLRRLRGPPSCDPEARGKVQKLAPKKRWAKADCGFPRRFCVGVAQKVGFETARENDAIQPALASSQKSNSRLTLHTVADGRGYSPVTPPLVEDFLFLDPVDDHVALHGGGLGKIV